MAACRLFDEDEVCLITPDKGYVYGLVLENAEFISSDEENDELPGQITKGSVRVAWHPDGKETVIEEDKVMLADRSLMPGDVVRHLDDNEDSQAGFVEDMSVTCHLHILGTDKYVYNVNSRDLVFPKYDLEPGDVTFDSWLGRVDAINEDIVLIFPDGAKCIINDNDICAFEDVTDKRSRHTEFCSQESYPFQELKGTMGDLSDVEWQVETAAYNATVVKNKPKMVVHVTVEEVKISSVEVHWLCRGLSKVENPLNTDSPPRQISGDDLNRLHSLDWFTHCSVQIGDQVQYVIPDTSVLSTTPPKHCAKPFNFRDMSFQSNTDDKKVETLKSSDTACNDVIDKTDSECLCNGDDEYEDIEDDSEAGSDTGSQASRDSDSSKKRKNPRKGPHLVTKTMKKVKGRRTKKKFNFPERVLKAGDTVTAEICYTFSKAKIRWQDASQSYDVPSTKLYPIHHLDALEFFPGDFVSDTRDDHIGDYGVVVSSNHKDRTCIVKWMKTYEVGKSTVPTCVAGPAEVSVYDVVDHLEYKFRTGYNVIRVGGFKSRNEELPAVGQVYNLYNNGTIDVKWSDGQITMCYPQDLYVSSDILEDFSDSELDSSETSDEDEDDDDESDESWETEAEDFPDVIDIDEEIIPRERSEDYDERKDIPFLNKEQNADVKILLDELPPELANLETVFQYLDENTPNLSSQYREILQMYSSCKYLDKMLKTSFFKDEELTDLITIIKSERKREKYKKISNRFQSLYFAWYKNVSSLPSNTNLEGPTGSEAVRTEPKSDPGQPGEDSTPSQNRSTKSLTDNKSAGDCCSPDDQTVRVSETSISSQEQVLKKESKEDSTVKGATSEHSSKELCLNVINKLREGIVKLQAEVGRYAEKIDVIIHHDGICYCDAGTQTENKQALDKEGHHLLEPSVSSVHPTSVKSEILDAKETHKQELSSVKCENYDVTHGQPSVKPENAEVKDKQMLGLHSVKSENLKMNGPQTICPPTVKSEILETKHTQVCKAASENNVDAESGSGHPCLLLGKAEIIDSLVKKVSVCDLAVQTDDIVDSDDSVLNSEENIVSAKEVASTQSSSTEFSEEITAENGCIGEDSIVRGFQLVDEALLCHRFHGNVNMASAPNTFNTAVRKELKLLKTSLPAGILVKCFADRLDLFSIMIVGPKKTPYEDGLFFFDVQLPADYPSSPPLFHYHSYCVDRLNPNLYDDGKVCVSLLGTWAGKGNEVWTSKSNMLQVLISIQGLILVSEPYYNEAGYEKQRGSSQAMENSRMYNEMAILKLVQSLTNMAKKPPKIFETETRKHLQKYGPRIINQLEGWMKLSDMKTKREVNSNSDHCGDCRSSSDEVKFEPDLVNEPEECISLTNQSKEKIDEPDFPLLPVSKGFRLTLKKQVALFRKALDEISKENMPDGGC